MDTGEIIIMQKSNKIQNKFEQTMFKYKFMEINPMCECANIFEITAGSEDDAFDLVDSEHNLGNIEILLTPRMIKSLKKEMKKLK